MATSKITINGVTVEVEGDNVVIRQGVIYVDGIAVQSQLGGDINVIWHGDLASLEVDGSVTCRDVDGNVTAGGSVTCRDVEGDITAGKSVQARGHGVRGHSGDIGTQARGHSGDVGRSVSAYVRGGNATASAQAHARGGNASSSGSASARIGHGDIFIN